MLKYILPHFFSIFILANPFSDEVYASVLDLTDPTNEEYANIQEYISHGNIPGINRMRDWRKELVPRDLVIYKEKTKIITRMKNFKCSKKSRENCIVLYCGIDTMKKSKILRLYRAIKNTPYRGFVILRIGGWPNISNGDIIRSHIPNAYKASAIREAKEYGFKRVLWLDCSMLPVTDLNDIFAKIEQNGIFSYLLPYSLRAMCGRGEHIQALNLTVEQAREMYTVVTNIIGINFEDPNATALFNRWYHGIPLKEKRFMTPHKDNCYISMLFNEYFDKSFFSPAKDHIDTEDEEMLEFIKI